MCIYMIINVFIQHRIRYIPACRTEIPSTPKMAAPVSLSQTWKFLLSPVRASSFSSFYKIAYGNTRRYTTVQVDMVTRDHTIEYFNAHIFGRLGYYFTYSYLKVSLKHPVSVFCDPNQMIAVMIQAVRAISVCLHPANLNHGLARSEVFPV